MTRNPSHPLITAAELRELQAAGRAILIFDCSYDLADHGKGRREFAQEHIAGAIFADVHDNLSAHGAPAVSGGRHPLPQRETFAAWLAGAGLSQDTLAVVYDRNRSNFCGRLWWMLRWVGHDQVRVLDGGLQAWKAAGGETTAAASIHAPGNFQLAPALVSLVDADHVHAHLDDGAQVLIDARAGERFRGEVEPLDPLAGHIPGALNRPFGSNLNADGSFKPAAELRADFEALLAGKGANVVQYCGSGVSATANLLAMEVAGLPASALYAGSWSDWSSRAELPKFIGPASKA